MTKYLEERKKADGTVYYAFNPSRGVRDALNLRYKKFTIKREATMYCQQVALEYTLHRRKNEGTVKIDDDSVLGLINFYKTTQEWLKLAENSQTFYDLQLRTATDLDFEHSRMTFGQQRAKNITATQADKLFTMIQRQYSDHRAAHVVKVLRKVYNVGFRHDKVPSNPFSNMKIPGLPTRKVLWEPGQVSKLIETADKMGHPSIGTITLLAYDLCARPGDMRQLTWANYHDEQFAYVQEKTKTIMGVAASPRLIERLKEHHQYDSLDLERIGCIAICETTGKPYSKDLLVKYFARVRKQSGLPTHLQLRDLRRTGATEMAEAGCTEDELRAVTGHQSREILATYVRPTMKLATSAINKRFAS
jgi:integrase